MKGAVVKAVKQRLPVSGPRAIFTMDFNSLPGFFERTAGTLIGGTIRYAGAAAKDIYTRLEAPIAGIDVPVGWQKYPSFTPRASANLDFIVKAVSRMMRGEDLSDFQMTVLDQNKDWLNLPKRLDEYAAQSAYLAEAYGNPGKAIDNFPKFYETLTIPSVRKRVEAFGVTAAAIQQHLRAAPSIDPVSLIWGLVNIDHSEITDEIADLIFEGVALPSGRKSRLFLTDGDLSSEAADEFTKSVGRNPDGSKPPQQFFAYTLPQGNRTLDLKRREAFGQYVSYLYKKDIPDALGDDLGDDADDEYPGEGIAPRSSIFVKKAYAKWPESFLHVFEKRQKALASATWDSISANIRAKFEQAGFDSAEKIADAINADQGQQRVAGEIGIIARNSQGKTGYIISAYDVILALQHPENARLAGGLIADPFYEKLASLAGISEFDVLYGTKKAEPQTIAQMAVLEFYGKIKDATKQNPLLQHAVTLEQLAELIGIKHEDLLGLLKNPAKAYSQTRDAIVPSKAMQIIEQRLGVSFLDEWKLINEEKAETDHAAAAAKAKDALTARQAIPTPPPVVPPAPVYIDPWAYISSPITAAVKAKFETPAALAKAIAEKTGGSISAEDVTQALRHPSNGILPDGRAYAIIHARIMQALVIKRADAAKTFIGEDASETSAPTARQEVQANIVGAFVRNPKLSHITNWKQLVQEHPKADVGDLLGTLNAAYRLRSQRDPSPVLIPRDSLVGIVDALNTGLPEERHTEIDNIVLVSVWREAFETKMGSDPIPPNMRKSAYELKLG